MKQKEIAPGIVVYDNVFENSNYLIEQLEESGLEWDRAKLFGGGKTIEQAEVYRSTDTVFLTPDKTKSNDLLNSLLNEFNNETHLAVKDYIIKFNANVVSSETPQLLRYNVGQQFKNHIDDHASGTRRVSLVYYINDNYTGGELVFDKFGVEIKPTKNQLLVFPSGFMYSHEAKAVLSGTKYAMVQWMA